MRYLLDTHTLLWFLSGDRQLGDRARELVGDSSNDHFLSIVSLWEIAIKAKKLALTKPFNQLFPEQLEFNGIGILDITVDSLTQLTDLPPHHGDPFDRLIIAQALVEELIIIGKDSAFDAYGVRREW